MWRMEIFMPVPRNGVHLLYIYVSWVYNISMLFYLILSDINFSGRKWIWIWRVYSKRWLHSLWFNCETGLFCDRNGSAQTGMNLLNVNFIMSKEYYIMIYKKLEGEINCFSSTHKGFTDFLWRGHYLRLIIKHIRNYY